MRPEWDDVWMQCAEVISERSRCSLAKVGAIIVTTDNRAMPPAYNGPPRGLPYEGECVNWCRRAQDVLRHGGKRNAEYASCEAVHDAANALIRADWTQIQGGTIYSSAAVCINCARLIANSGITTVVHKVSEADRHRNPEGVEAFLRSAGLEVRRKS